VSQRDYANLLAHRDDSHLPIFKTRRSFLYENQQYQLDIYRSPCHSRCQGLVLLETFTTSKDEELMSSLPPFLRVKKNVTGDPAFSMYNLSLRSDWTDSVEQFCHRMQSSDSESEEEAVYDVKKAHERLVRVSESMSESECRRPSLVRGVVMEGWASRFKWILPCDEVLYLLVSLNIFIQWKWINSILWWGKSIRKGWYYLF